MLVSCWLLSIRQRTQHFSQPVSFKTQTKYVTVRCFSHFPQEGRVWCLALATSSGRMNGAEQKSIKIRNGTVDTWPVPNFQQPIFTSHHGDAKQVQWWAKFRPYHGVKVFPVSFDKNVLRLCLEFQVPKKSFIPLPTPPFHDVMVRVFWCVQCRVKATTYFWIIFVRDNQHIQNGNVDTNIQQNAWETKQKNNLHSPCVSAHEVIRGDLGAVMCRAEVNAVTNIFF